MWLFQALCWLALVHQAIADTCVINNYGYNGDVENNTDGNFYPGEQFGVYVTVAPATCTASFNTGDGQTFTVPDSRSSTGSQTTYTFKVPNGYANTGQYTPSIVTGGTTYNQDPVTVQACNVILQKPNGQTSNQQPVFSGTTTDAGACSDATVTVVVDSGSSDSISFTGTASGGTFSFTPPQNIPYGKHSATASVTVGGTTSTSKDLGFTIIVPSPGSSRKKRVVCPFDQDMCPHITKKGTLEYICIPDVYSNIEVCGSCKGEDCTALPGVDLVACNDGTCQVQSCIEGFKLKNHRCVEITKWRFISQ